MKAGMAAAGAIHLLCVFGREVVMSDKNGLLTASIEGCMSVPHLTVPHTCSW